MNGLQVAAIGVSVAVVVSIMGCTTRPAVLGPGDYGQAYTTARDSQLLNPGAGKNLEPTMGREDAIAAKNTMERYRDSFEDPEKVRKPIVAPSVVSQGIGSK